MKVLRHAALATAVLASVLTAGCASQSSGHSAGHATGAIAPAAHPERAPRAAAPKVTKLLVVVEENHSLSQMKAGMPYTFGLAKKYGYATRYRAITHPSEPNYIAIASGKTYGIQDDADPSAHRLRGTSVFGQALARGRTAASYLQSMPTQVRHHAQRRLRRQAQPVGLLRQGAPRLPRPRPADDPLRPGRDRGIPARASAW